MIPNLIYGSDYSRVKDLRPGQYCAFADYPCSAHKVLWADDNRIAFQQIRFIRAKGGLWAGCKKYRGKNSHEFVYLIPENNLS